MDANTPRARFNTVIYCRGITNMILYPILVYIKCTAKRYSTSFVLVGTSHDSDDAIFRSEILVSLSDHCQSTKKEKVPHSDARSSMTHGVLHCHHFILAGAWNGQVGFLVLPYYTRLLWLMSTPPLE